MIGWKHLYRQLSADNDTEADNGWCMKACFGEEYRTLQSRQDISLSGRNKLSKTLAWRDLEQIKCRHVDILFIASSQEKLEITVYQIYRPSLSASSPYLEYIGGPSPSSSTPFHLGFVHHRATLFLADLIQNVVGLQEEDKSQFRNHCCNGVRGNKVSLQWARSKQKNHNYLIPIMASQWG